MADQKYVLNNYSDDSQIKEFMRATLAPKVFDNIPINVLNTGLFSLVSEYISQITEQLSFTSSFYFNEGFITKAVLPDSIYAEAAIFNIGYSFATPASANFLLELRIDDLIDHATLNVDTGLREFILDKNTKFNLPEGYMFSLDYDILVQFKDKATASIDAPIPSWNVQYINKDEANVCATNKNPYIVYRVTDKWLCLLIQANEYERTEYNIPNTMTNGVPNEDTVITCDNHIAGFDVTYIDAAGNEYQLPRDHILAIHDHVPDGSPYVHYIMDNPQTIRFMWQLNGNRYFVPASNSSYKITIYTCHGKSANAPNYKNEQQPGVITSSNRYPNNSNVMKAAFVIGGIVGGADIGSVETVRRETIEAYNTANVLSTDHDIDEWFKTFYFKNILYPYFFKRRDDPWGRVWSGFMALSDNDDYVYRTNTLHAHIGYDVLYNNNDNTVSNNEIIIPPGWVWIYDPLGDIENRWTVIPYTAANSTLVEKANTKATIPGRFVFSNPFGIRIQKQPFAIGYFNPWVNEWVTATKITKPTLTTELDETIDSVDMMYHATPIITNIKRTYKDDFYSVRSDILPTIYAKENPITKVRESLVTYMQSNAMEPDFSTELWNYFKKPLDLYAESMPILQLTKDDGYIGFNPDKTYLCVKSKTYGDDMPNQSTGDNVYQFDISEGVYVLDETSGTPKITYIDISTNGMILYGSNELWGDDGVAKPVGYEEDNKITLSPEPGTDENPIQITFTRKPTQNYYEMKISEDVTESGTIKAIRITKNTGVIDAHLSKYGEGNLYRIGKSYAPSTSITIEYVSGTTEKAYYVSIVNAANIYTPYEPTLIGNEYVIDTANLGQNAIILYADMKPTPDSDSVNYYKLRFSDIPANTPLFYVHSNQLPLDQNNMRVLIHAIANGSETGIAEMEPVKQNDDGSYTFESRMYPLTELIDIDNRVTIASMDNGGGSWYTTNGNSVYLDAYDPRLKISILIKSSDPNKPSPVGDERYKGYILVDEYMLDDVDLVQELKEMRSVVDFKESSRPTDEQEALYGKFVDLSKVGVGEYEFNNMYAITSYADIRKDGGYPKLSFTQYQASCAAVKDMLDEYFAEYAVIVSEDIPEWFGLMDTTFDSILNTTPDASNKLDWNAIYTIFANYPNDVKNAFESIHANGYVEIQLMPFVERNLMNSDRFENFVTSFTQVHKAIEPVIFKRLEGNNYLDCKLIATYGLPHSYCPDDKVDLPDSDPNAYWPDLNIKLEFDVKLYNQALEKNTISELRSIVQSYFNRITNVHTPVEAISMDNNIYISHVIQQMEAHDNVAWMKFKGWYTDEKGMSDGRYMDANTQAIVQKWKTFEDMMKDENGQSELQRYVPEMFVMDPNNIVINIIK